MQLKFKGETDFKELTADDMKSVGIEGFSKTVWAKGDVKEVPDDVGNWLLENQKDDFESVDASSSDEDDSQSEAGSPKGRRNA